MFLFFPSCSHLLGAAAPKPAFGGFGATTPAPAAPGAFSFGAAPAPAAPAAGGFSFGAPAATAPGKIFYYYVYMFFLLTVISPTNGS